MCDFDRFSKIQSQLSISISLLFTFICSNYKFWPTACTTLDFLGGKNFGPLNLSVVSAFVLWVKQRHLTDLWEQASMQERDSYY